MTWQITIKGQVQGVGFRPFVWRAALDRNLNGWVVNDLEGVLIKINGTEQQALEFQQYLLKNAPDTACITDASLASDKDLSFFDNFSIRNSSSGGLPIVSLTPDVAICASCRQDISNPANRRYRYPFTTCTVCGPRYSILTGLPYDRPRTTMRSFAMCNACQSEYDDPTDRRYYAQTNSCPQCGISMGLFQCRANTRPSEREESFDHGEIVQKVIAAWQHGAIVAVKGIGGYLLTCDASNPKTVATLRDRKHRPGKPFALMYPDIATLKSDAEVPEAALQQLQSPAAPIVLLDVQKTPGSGSDHSGIAPGLRKIGVMLPNAPLFELLLAGFGSPIIATSGNVSNAPLIYDDETALNDLSDIADYILVHNRPIVMPQDDSVVAIRQSGAETGSSSFPPLVLRRGRGLSPALIQTGLAVPNVTVLALGAEMKSTFTLVHLSNVNVSQYLGDLAHFDTQQRFSLVLYHLSGLVKAQPEVVISDLHPGYFTTQLGSELAEQWQIPHIQVQHHKAHFAAVLAENNLLTAEEPVLGVIWDGTGLGDDGQIWGGEFFLHTPQKPSARPEFFERAAHFDYMPVLLGDKMSREPRLSALSACLGIDEADEWLRPKFSSAEWVLYHKIPAQTMPIKTSSLGRIFDAVASLLGLTDKLSYEGEAAMLLEDLARGYCKQSGFAIDEDYLPDAVQNDMPLAIDTKNLFRQIIRDLNFGAEKARIAAKFHITLVKMIGRIASRFKTKKIAFSGGVFQNILLLDLIHHYLSTNFQLYFHRQLPPNDENISFGQWAYWVATKDSFQPNSN